MCRTLASLRPWARAMRRVLQWVAWGGRVCSVASTTARILLAGMRGIRPGRGASFSRLGKRSAKKRCRQSCTVGRDTPSRRAIGVVGSVLLVHALPNLTRVHCIEGLVSVQNINPAIVGQVTLHAGEFTTVARGLSPTAPVYAPATQMESQISQTNVGPPTAPAGGPGGLGGAAKAPWHIGSLSHAASIAVAATAAAGAAAAIAVPLATRGPVSPTAP